MTAKDLALLREDFRVHTSEDVTRFGEVREDLQDQRRATSDLEKSVSNLQGRLIALGGVAIVLIPLLTVLASALLGSHGK